MLSKQRLHLLKRRLLLFFRVMYFALDYFFFGVWESAMSCWIWAFPPFLQAREKKRS